MFSLAAQAGTCQFANWYSFDTFSWAAALMEKMMAFCSSPSRRSFTVKTAAVAPPPSLHPAQPTSKTCRRLSHLLHSLSLAHWKTHSAGISVLRPPLPHHEMLLSPTVQLDAQYHVACAALNTPRHRRHPRTCGVEQLRVMSAWLCSPAVFSSSRKCCISIMPT